MGKFDRDLRSLQKASEALTALEREHPDVFNTLYDLVEDYNTALNALEAAVRSETGPMTVGPFKAIEKKVTVIDVAALLLTVPQVLIEPGVISKVKLETLADAAKRTGVEREVVEATSKTTQRSVSADWKPLVLAWPKRV